MEHEKSFITSGLEWKQIRHFVQEERKKDIKQKYFKKCFDSVYFRANSNGNCDLIDSIQVLYKTEKHIFSIVANC